MLSENIKTARKAAGMTQKEVAAQLGITESTYCGYETNKRQPDAVKIGQMARIFDVSGDYLLDILPQTEKSPDADDTAPRDAKEREIMRLVRLLDDPQKDMLLLMLEPLVAQKR